MSHAVVPGRGTSRQRTPIGRARPIRTSEPLEPRLLFAASAVINEIHYDPDIKTEFVEFVELYNPGDTALDLSGAMFTSGVSYTFPAGTSLPAGGYVLVSENPTQFQAKFGRAALGPWVGGLDNDGEELTLEDSAGNVLDEVDYNSGFPWPTVGESPGYSIELINPNFDNDLGGNWRSHTPQPSGDMSLFASTTAWKYRKGTSEASNPVTAWRQQGFDDTTWLTGNGAIGFDSQGSSVNTNLTDMRNGYTSVFLRRTFNVSAADLPFITALRMEAKYDDGFKVWINGSLLRSQNISTSEVAYNATASTGRESNNYDTFQLGFSSLVAGTNTIAVQFWNQSGIGGGGFTADAFFDARLIATRGGGQGSPTPGATNTVFAANAAPQMRQVDHTPQKPASGQDVTITAKVTDPDGVTSVNLLYQLVDPGNYIAKEDAAYENAANWTTVAMRDDGTNGDVTAADSVYTAVLPGSLQTHRRLVRYRLRATDGAAAPASITVPYADDPQPNFAYYVYDGVPTWTGSVQPGGTPVTYSTDVMNSLPTYQLITKRVAHEDSQHIPNSSTSAYGGDAYLWSGTLVYDGRVYDHIHYRARGGVWRYAMGKNMWKIDFNRGHELRAKDIYGNPYPERWTKLNLGANIQQGDYQHRGEQGLFETVGFQLFNLAGVPASRSNPIHFRIVERATETNGTASQYDDDFQGLYLALEQDDGRFLDAHDLPDGNFYKMESGTGPGGGTKNNQGATQPLDNSDLVAFTTAYGSNQTDQWWRDNFNLASYYSYRAILEGMHHYDIGAGKNYFYYHNPETNKWEEIPWDLDLTWADNMFGDGNEPFRSRVLAKPAFLMEYRNRLREIRDLLLNGEQTGQLIDEYADIVDRPGDTDSFVDADRAMWDYNPILANTNYVNSSKAGQGRFYGAAIGPGGFRGMAEKMKSYVAQRSAYIDNTLITAADEAAAPLRPTVSYTGPANYPADALTFSTTGFAPGNQGGAFAAMQWRIADVTDTAPGAPGNYEITAAWTSAELTSFDANVTIPVSAVIPGHTYRVRVRMKDSNGRWGHWSDASGAPAQFVVGPGNPLVRDSLRITEINYHPADAPNNTPVDDEFEYVELTNIGVAPINLNGTRFTKGIDYTFGNVDLPAGARIIVARNPSMFQQRYGNLGAAFVVGGYAPDVLDNGGDRLKLMDITSTVIHDFDFDDAWYPVTDGGGRSLVIRNPGAATSTWADPLSWSASLPGDANHDHRVDVADLGILSTYYGATSGANLTTGDLNGDGRVDVADLGILSTNYGSTIGGPALTAAQALSAAAPVTPAPTARRTVTARARVAATLRITGLPSTNLRRGL